MLDVSEFENHDSRLDPKTKYFPISTTRRPDGQTVRLSDGKTVRRSDGVHI